MSDTISRQAAIEQAVKESQVEGAYGYMDTKSIVDMLNGLPTIDAVEVVRCKDCEHYNAGFECLIEGYGIKRNPNWFCADGERRTDG